MAQRALALFMALVLATTLTPSFSYADEVGATNNTPAVENAADAGTASVSGDQQKQVVSSDEGANAANNAATATARAPSKVRAAMPQPAKPETTALQTAPPLRRIPPPKPKPFP